MKIRTISRMLSVVLCAAALCMLGLSSRADDSLSGFIGTWALNVDKSTFDPGPPMKSHKMTVSDAGNGALHFSADMVEGDGTARHFELTSAADGKEVPVTGFTGYADSAVITTRRPRSFHIVFKNAGKPVEWDTFHLSKDSKRIYGRLAGNDNGTHWKYHWVQERQ